MLTLSQSIWWSEVIEQRNPVESCLKIVISNSYTAALDIQPEGEVKNLCVAGKVTAPLGVE
jgi:hypothetical protein